MKKIKLIALVVALLSLCVVLTSCVLPVDDPVVQDVVEGILVAAFSYTTNEYPVQTGSKVVFDANASYDSDGEIVWGEWDFGDGKVVSGQWTEVVQKIVNGTEVFETVSVMREQGHKYNIAPWNQVPPLAGRYYTVALTVLDNDGNVASVSKRIKIHKDD